MAKWQRSKEDEEIHLFFFDKICGPCITEEDISFYKRRGGLIMLDNKEIKGVFTYSSETKKYFKFIFKTVEGVVGNVFIPKGVREIPSQIILRNEMTVKVLVTR